ncbi:MAG: hypothetical protein AAFP19_25325, partial [Bacteroidota bacterium]
MKQAIKCYIKAWGVLLCFLLLGASVLPAQTRSLQWDLTVNYATVSVDELCPATKGYIEFTPKDKLAVGLTDHPTPATLREMNCGIYPVFSPTTTQLFFYEDGVSIGTTTINATPQNTDLIKIDRKGSLIKLYFNGTLVHTSELDANPTYRAYAYNFGSDLISSMGAIASRSLIEPCSNYNTGSNNALPSAQLGEAHNWVHSKVFNEQGDIVGETRVYLDRLGSAVQTQTKNYASNEVIGKQLVYDAQGRNTLVSMPAPTDDDHIEYQAEFLESASSNQAFNYTDFDTPSKLNNPSKAKTISGTVGRHYSDYGENYVPTTRSEAS